ncbi:XRE family transcriptional regulator [Burkholderia cepacia]|uniref:helix-turn-helix domain-containing protein n=1 Tax=Burkholderia cepacia TaxID=292 RepID=UPI000F5B83F2|nr:helix-turn-helix transcriptional regulator [Burkholderia cepacia]RQT42811.1 XRE family transcriptional regulator [Burkholderia cepacia]
MTNTELNEFDPYLRRRIANNVWKLRNERDLSQEKLSALCGFRRAYVSQGERSATNVSADNLQRLAQGLDVDPVALFKP